MIIVNQPHRKRRTYETVLSQHVSQYDDRAVADTLADAAQPFNNII